MVVQCVAGGGAGEKHSGNEQATAVPALGIKRDDKGEQVSAERHDKQKRNGGYVLGYSTGGCYQQRGR